MALAAALLLGSAEAVALEQLTHRWTTEAECERAGFPGEFCTRIGVENGNVDSHEWDDMAAHAQSTSPDAMCEGAKATLTRVHGIGQRAAVIAKEAVDAASEEERRNAAQRLADELGRALHTVQDLCAHAGMTNVQHAWFSASDQCDGTTASPDVQPDALDCATERTRAVFEDLRVELEALGLAPPKLEDLTAYEGRTLPTNVQLCEYLVSAGDWDGKDRRWRLDVMKPLVGDALVRGLRGEPAPEVECEGLDAAPAPDVDVSGGPEVCTQSEAVCRSAGREGPGCGCSAVSGVNGMVLLSLLALAARITRRSSEQRCN